MVREIPWREILGEVESFIILERCVDSMIEREGYWCDKVRRLPGHKCFRDSLHYFNHHWSIWYLDHNGSSHTAKLSALDCGDMTPEEIARRFPCIK